MPIDGTENRRLPQTGAPVQVQHLHRACGTENLKTKKEQLAQQNHRLV